MATLCVAQLTGTNPRHTCHCDGPIKIWLVDKSCLYSVQADVPAVKAKAATLSATKAVLNCISFCTRASYPRKSVGSCHRQQPCLRQAADLTWLSFCSASANWASLLCRAMPRRSASCSAPCAAAVACSHSWLAAASCCWACASLASSCSCLLLIDARSAYKDISLRV